MFLVIESDQILGQFDNQKQAEEEAAWIAHLSGLNAVVVPEWQLNSPIHRAKRKNSCTMEDRSKQHNN